MRKITKVFGIALIGALLAIPAMTSCSEKAERISAEEMAEQMEAAKEGREAAKAIVTKEWKDSMELQEAVLSARAANSKYEIDGKAGCKAAFDTAFFNTIRTVRPELADRLQP